MIWSIAKVVQICCKSRKSGRIVAKPFHDTYKKIPSHTKKARLGIIGTYYLYISYSVQPGFCPSLGFNVIWLLGIG